ncbi:sensor domain-containing diguanylate cyclase [Chitinibacteraceae bacterium HSL-7]
MAKLLLPDSTLLQQVLDEVGAYVFTKDMDGRYTYANRLVLELLGLTLDDIVGSTDEAFFDLERAGGLRVNDRLVLDEGQTIEREEENVLRHSGETRVYWSVKRPLYGATGERIGLVGISTDITEQKRLATELAHQHTLLKTVLDNLDAYVYMKDDQRVFRYANPATARLFGRPVEAIVGTLDTELLPKDIADQFYKLDERVFRTGRRQSAEERFTSPDGTVTYYWSTKVPIQLENDSRLLLGFSSDVTELHKLREKLQQEASTDYLTGVNNRRHFFEIASAETARTRRHSRALSLITFDLDHFKDVNDQFGHPMGDQVLQAVARRVAHIKRSEDTLARMGGEEFTLLLPDTRLSDAVVMAERIRQSISEIALSTPYGTPVGITTSVGVAELADSDHDIHGLYQRADRALYIAKGAGRDCVRIDGHMQD